MAVDKDTVRRITMLARLEVPEDQLDALSGELNKILTWMEQLNEVDTEGIEPMTAVKPMPLRQRADEVSVGDLEQEVLANAPDGVGPFFTVPKVVE